MSLGIIMNAAWTRQHSMNLYGKFVSGCAVDECGPENVWCWRPRPVFYSEKASVSRHRLLSDFDKYVMASVQALLLKADVVHIVDHSNAWLGFFARSNKYVVTVHDLIPWLCASGKLPGWKPSAFARALIALNGIAIKRANHIVSVSHSTTRDLIDFGVPSSKITTIPHCILQEFPEPCEPAAIPGDLGKTFVHFGAGKYHKNTELVVEAFRLLRDREPQCRLVLVGKHSAEANVNEGANGIVRLPFLAPSEMAYVYRRCAALLMPSRYEGFGLPVLEAQAQGCPVIASDGGSLGEVMGDSGIVLNNPIAPEVLADAMFALVTNEQMRSTVISSGVSNASRYGRSACAAAYRGLYKELLLLSDGAVVRDAQVKTAV